MASKFTKFLLFSAVSAAAGACVYYYFQKRDAASGDDGCCCGDGDSEATEKSRSYVSLNLDNVESALQKAKEKITDSYQQVRDTVLTGFAGGGGARDFTDLTRDEADEADGEADGEAGDAPDGESADADGATVEEFFDEESSN